MVLMVQHDTLEGPKSGNLFPSIPFAFSIKFSETFLGIFIEFASDCLLPLVGRGGDFDVDK